VTADFYFGAMSPYSWFAAERIGGVVPDATWRPVFAGGLFKAAGRTSWGLTDEREAKLADCEVRAAAHGLGPIRWPEPWPTVDLAAARALVWAAERRDVRPFALELMRLAFREGADVGELDAVLEAARRAGLDPGEVAAAVAAPDVKAAAREATDAAVARGVIGVPTVAIGDRLFWGDDRLDEAARA
jgi:2-hydroxychromene-2-carboxylate isomerase